MAATTFTTALSLGELEANYALYCKAMRNVCWSRLSSLHGCMPGQYRHPEQLFLLSRQFSHATSR